MVNSSGAWKEAWMVLPGSTSRVSTTPSIGAVITALASSVRVSSSRVAASGRYQVIPRSQLRRRLAEQKRESYKLCYDESCQIELGKALAAQHSLATRLTAMNERCVLSAVLYDLTTELSRVAAVVQTTCDAEALLGALSELVGKLAPKPASQAP